MIGFTQHAAQLVFRDDPHAGLALGLPAHGVNGHAKRRQQLGKTATDPELKETLHNLEAFGHLAHYYSHKIEGATQVGLFRVTGEPSQKQLAIQSLTAALKDWQAYSLLMDTMYKPQLLARTAMLDPKRVLADVKRDIDIAQSAKQGEVVKVGDNNKLWERDQRKF